LIDCFDRFFGSKETGSKGARTEEIGAKVSRLAA
jgi:hypothetical protein